MVSFFLEMKKNVEVGFNEDGDGGEQCCTNIIIKISRGTVLFKDIQSFLSPYSTEKRVCVGHEINTKNMKCTCPTPGPNATYIPLAGVGGNANFRFGVR